MVLNFEVSEIKVFKNIIDVTSLYVDELVFTASGDGLGFKALDGGHVCFLMADMGVDWFTSYECSEEVSFMVDLLELKQVLGRIKGDGVLTCELTDEYFILKHSTIDGSSKSFKLRLIDNMYEPPTPPSIPYSTHALVEYDQLREYCGDAMLYGNKVWLEFNNNKLCVSGRNDFTDYESSIVLLEPASEPCKVILSTEHLQGFFKLNLSETCTIDTGNGTPLLATLQSVDESLTFKFLIAPRIEEDV